MVYFQFLLAIISKPKSFFYFGELTARGILLGAGCIHLLPDALELMASAKVANANLFVGLVVIASLIILWLFKFIFVNTVHARDPEKNIELIPYLLTFLLSVHSLITGVALGMETVLSHFALLFFAIVAHKGAAAFALGINVGYSYLKSSTKIKLIILFSCMTPLGILFGQQLIAVLTTRTGIVSEALFNAFAAGTFIYIALIEGQHYPPDAAWRITRIVKLLAFSSGLLLMGIIAVWL